MSCPTVKIKCASVPGNEAGEMFINASDFDPRIHQAVDPSFTSRAPAAPETAQEPAPAGSGDGQGDGQGEGQGEGAGAPQAAEQPAGEGKKPKRTR